MSTIAYTVKKAPTKAGDGGIRKRAGQIVFDNAYVNGTGYAITPATFGFPTAITALVIGNAKGYQPAWDGGTANGAPQTGTSHIFVYKGNTEAATNESGLNGLAASFFAWGY